MTTFRFTKADLGPPRNARKLNAALFQELQSIFNTGIGAFVGELARRLAQHVDTGESIASLQPLADAVGASIPFSVRLGQGRKRQSLDTRSGKPRGVRRSPFSGIQLGQDAFTIDFDTSTFNFTFTFEIPTYQFAIHENGSAFTGGSGEMLGALDAAFRVLLDTINIGLERRAVPLVETWAATGKIRKVRG